MIPVTSPQLSWEAVQEVGAKVGTQLGLGGSQGTWASLGIYFQARAKERARFSWVRRDGRSGPCRGHSTCKALEAGEEFRKQRKPAVRSGQWGEVGLRRLLHPLPASLAPPTVVARPTGQGV